MSEVMTRAENPRPLPDWRDDGIEHFEQLAVTPAQDGMSRPVSQSVVALLAAWPAWLIEAAIAADTLYHASQNAAPALVSCRTHGYAAIRVHA